MDLIKLPMTIGLKVLEVLKEKGYSPRVSKLGLYSFEFTADELSQITELTFINPLPNCLAGIEYLSNLKKLKIVSTINTAYSNETVSINDKDIARISKLTSLTSLKIENQSEISWVDLENLVNLEEVSISRNSHLDELSGLDKLRKLNDFAVYGNKNLYRLEGIIDLITQNQLDFIELDLMNYPEVLPLKGDLYRMVNLFFNEATSAGIVSYSIGQASIFHEKCLAIASTIQSYSQNRKAQVIAVEKYLAEHVAYDTDGVKRSDRAFYENGKKRGKKSGTNSAYNGIMFGSCVCEGYTRSMQYILKLLGIKTTNVSCIAGANKIEVNTSYHNMVSLPDDGYHSIIRIDDEDMLYCDPCWDSCYWKKGRQNLPYCLLTKGEMSQDHTLSFEEDIISNDHLKIPREKIQTILTTMQELFPKKNTSEQVHK